MEEWLRSVVLWWDAQGRDHVLAGPGAGDLPGGVDVLHVLTSQDPAGVAQSEARNRQLLGELLARLGRDPALRAVRWWPATGGLLDLAHHEQGVAIAGLERAAASQLGAELEQLAIYEMTPSWCRVVTCPGDVVDEQVPRRWGGDHHGLPPEVIERWWQTYVELQHPHA